VPAEDQVCVIDLSPRYLSGCLPKTVDEYHVYQVPVLPRAQHIHFVW
jgi:hypothetical protein